MRSSGLSLLPKPIGMGSRFQPWTVGLVGASLLAVGFLILVVLMPPSWTWPLHPHYFGCPEEKGLANPPIATSGPDPEALWKVFELDQLSREMQANSGVLSEYKASLERERSHFLAEVAWTSADMALHRPIYLQDKGFPNHPYSEEELQSQGRSWGVDQKSVVDTLSGLPFLDGGDLVNSSQRGHWAGRLETVHWYASRGIYAVNSTKRMNP